MSHPPTAPTPGRPASQRKQTRFVIPSDVFTLLCVALAKQSDDFLLLVQRTCKAAEKYGDDKLVDDLAVIVQSLNGHTEDMREMLRAILEEQPEASDGRA